MPEPASKTIDGWTIDIRIVPAIRRAPDGWNTTIVFAHPAGHELTLREPFDNVRVWWEAWHPPTAKAAKSAPSPTVAAVNRAMREAGGDIQAAARVLGVSPSSILDMGALRSKRRR